MVLFCLGLISLALCAWQFDWSHKPVFYVMAIIGFLFLGSKKELPNEDWSPQQKAAWTKRFTTIKVKDNQLVYVSGESPNSIDTYDLSNIKLLNDKGNKLVITFIDGTVKKISTKYWSSDNVQDFIKTTNELLASSS